jgi:hypothetical protein
MLFHADEVFPESSNLFWDISQKTVRDVLSQNPVIFSSVTWLVLEVTSGSENFRKSFVFDEQDKLFRVEMELMRSRDFSDDDSLEQIEKFGAEFEDAYLKTVGEYVKVLGEPTFSGGFDDTGYPNDEWVWQLSFWNLGRNQFRIELDQPDRELPFTLKLASHKV